MQGGVDKTFLRMKLFFLFKKSRVAFDLRKEAYGEKMKKGISKLRGSENLDQITDMVIS